MSAANRPSAGADLDVITYGRASVDLYGQQIGGRLEDVSSFAKSVGGSPTNIAVGCARLGLAAGLVTAVGDEAMGRFVREQLGREGIVTDGVKVDPARLTALVLLGVRDERSFPLIFYRENCADMGLTEADIDPAFIARARALVATGTHFSRPNVDAAGRKAIAAAKAAGRRVALDIDYRPNLWGVAGHGEGESRYVRASAVTEHLQTLLPSMDLVVGTEEEFHIAGGAEDTRAALLAVRALTDATLVLKRGPMGCVVFTGKIPDRLEDGIRGPGYPVAVYNVLGAGDGFMAGFLRGWVRGEPLETCAAWANACGAFAVSRLLCAPEYPTWPELCHFLAHGSRTPELRKDADLSHLHWATTRRPRPEGLMALAIDHRAQLEDLADRLGADRGRIAAFKRLAVAAAARVADGRPGFGVLLDGIHGREALFDAAGHDFWIGRPVEQPGSRPLTFEGVDDLGSHLVEWPVIHTIKCLCFYHPDDPPALKAAQEEKLLALYDAARTVGRELLVEIIASRHGPVDDDTVAAVITRLYALGIKPDWWKLEGQPGERAWAAIERAIAAGDPWCRGVVLLGLEAPEEDLVRTFRAAATAPVVKGFAIGRSIFAEAAEAWLAGRIDDAAAIDDMAARFGRLVAAWEAAAARRDAA
jgi:5-dehydro-2-deoxygluconokinase